MMHQRQRGLDESGRDGVGPWISYCSFLYGLDAGNNINILQTHQYNYDKSLRAKWKDKQMRTSTFR